MISVKLEMYDIILDKCSIIFTAFEVYNLVYRLLKGAFQSLTGDLNSSYLLVSYRFRNRLTSGLCNFYQSEDVTSIIGGRKNVHKKPAEKKFDGIPISNSLFTKFTMFVAFLFRIRKHVEPKSIQS